MTYLAKQTRHCLLAGNLLLGMACSSPTAAAPLQFADEGVFFIGGRQIQSSAPGISPAGAVPVGTIVVDQMYVHYRIPAQVPSRTPIVLVHGGGLTGASFETTPDGREGWATYFVRQGHPVYVVDTPGRGRSGFDATSINQAKKDGSTGALPPSVLMVTAELAWTLFRFGPAFGTPFPGTQFPVEAMSAFGAQVVPFAESLLKNVPMDTVPNSLAALLENIGPSVVVVHSLSGPFADALVGIRPKLVRAVINIEGSQSIVPTDAQISAYAGIPDLELFGDNLDSASFTGRPRFNARKSVVERINRVAGGRAEIVTLPSVGIRGNSHMIMQDKNNLQVADFILNWLRTRASEASR